MPWLPRAGWRGAHLAALWAFAFVQPLFDLLGRNAEFFIARGNGRADILIFAIVFAVVPPLAMLAVEELVARVSRRAAGILHLGLVALLVTAFVVGAVNESHGLSAGVVIAGGLVVGAAVALAYRRIEIARTLASFLTPAPAVFLAIFLLFSEASELVRPAADVENFGVTGRSDAPVFVVVFDELPVATLMDSDGAIDAANFPNFARLAGDSTWFRRATSVADRTAQAVPAILTGLQTESGLTPTAADHPQNLFTLFAGGRSVNGWESATRLCPVSVCDRSSDPLLDRLGSLFGDLRVVSQHLLLPESLTAGLPPVDQAFLGFESDDESHRVEGLDSERLAGLLEGIEQSDGAPSLNFVHFDAPHVPWHRLPDGRTCQPDTWDAAGMIGGDGAWIADRNATRLALSAHLLQAGYADRLLGELIDRLRESRIWKRSAVVVVADHGVAFDPGGLRRTLSSRNVGATLRVPLFVKKPGQRLGRVSDRQARTVDVLPTVADLVGAELPFEVDGVPADRAPRRAPVSAYAQTQDAIQSWDAATLERSRARLSAQKERLVGQRGSFQRLFAAGPEPALIGTTPDNAGEPHGSYELVAPEAYDDVDLATEVPCQLVATLDGIEPGEPLAVVVNGEVATTTTAYESGDGAVQAFALVPPRAFEPGDNDVSLWRIAGNGRARVLEALEVG